MEHIATCFQLDWRPCPASEDGRHRWSGWPGAYCQDCFDEDPDELCVGLVCAYSCHDGFWAEYTAYQGSDQEYTDDWERECDMWSEVSDAPRHQDFWLKFWASWWWPMVPLAMLAVGVAAVVLWPA